MIKSFLLSFIVLIFISKAAVSQEVAIPKSLKRFSNSKCYWSYSVERESTISDSIHKYIIRVELIEEDSIGNYRWGIGVKNGSVYCSFNENEIYKKIYFKQAGKQWVAKFSISTNRPLPVKIIATYKHQERTMPLTLNEGTYPGEPDS